jgi:hypothetical protein
MGRGASKAGGAGGGSGPKTQLEMQIDNLEKNIWRGSGKALNPSKLNAGDRIDGVQYSFQSDVLNPTRNKSAWTGDYNGAKIRFSADNTFQVTSVVSNGKSTTITATKIGGAGGTVKKRIPNDVYLRVFKS